jgi:hypothetical protein
MPCVCTVLYCHLWPLHLYHIFPHYLTNSTFSGKNLLHIKLCFDIQYNFCLKYSPLYEEFREILPNVYIVLKILPYVYIVLEILPYVYRVLEILPYVYIGIGDTAINVHRYWRYYHKCTQVLEILL